MLENPGLVMSNLKRALLNKSKFLKNMFILFKNTLSGVQNTNRVIRNINGVVPTVHTKITGLRSCIVSSNATSPLPSFFITLGCALDY